MRKTPPVPASAPARVRAYRRRRAKGSGTVYKRADGLWVAEVTKDGERLRRTASTKDLASARLARALSGTSARIDADPTVGEQVLAWIEGRAGLRDLTRVNYRRIADNHIVPSMGQVKLRDLTVPKVRNMLADMAAQGLGPGTRRNARNVLSGACQQAVEDGLILANPAHIKVPGANSRSVVRVSAADAVRMLDAIQDHPLRDLWALQLYCGLRVGEALGLEWQDVRNAEATLHIRRNDSRVLGDDGELKRGFVKPKTKSGERVTPMPGEAVKLMWTRYHKMGDPKRGLVFPSVRDSEQATAAFLCPGPVQEGHGRRWLQPAPHPTRDAALVCHNLARPGSPGPGGVEDPGSCEPGRDDERLRPRPLRYGEGPLPGPDLLRRWT